MKNQQSRVAERVLKDLEDIRRGFKEDFVEAN